MVALCYSLLALSCVFSFFPLPCFSKSDFTDKSQIAGNHHAHFYLPKVTECSVVICAVLLLRIRYVEVMVLNGGLGFVCWVVSFSNEPQSCYINLPKGSCQNAES